jgi:hypothetical protein
MPGVRAIRFASYQGSAVIMLARVEQLETGTPITTTSVTSIEYYVGRQEGELITGPLPLAPVSSYVFNTLQLDNLWTVDEIGYNFRVTADSTWFPMLTNCNELFIVNFVLTPVDDPNNKLVIAYEAIRLPTLVGA